MGRCRWLPCLVANDQSSCCEHGRWRQPWCLQCGLLGLNYASTHVDMCLEMKNEVVAGMGLEIGQIIGMMGVNGLPAALFTTTRCLYVQVKNA